MFKATQGLFLYKDELYQPKVPEQGGAGWARGQYCPFHSSAIVTKQTPANLKAVLSNAEEI